MAMELIQYQRRSSENDNDKIFLSKLYIDLMYRAFAHISFYKRWFIYKLIIYPSFNRMFDHVHFLPYDLGILMGIE